MPEGRQNSPAILHVVTGGAPPADLERWLASAPFTIDTLSDVYRGLARALTSSDYEIQAVIVGVDNLAGAEFEFFSILARQSPNSLICIYGSESQRAEVKSLIRSDRIADLSRDGLDALRRLAITSQIESRSAQGPLSATTEISPQTQKAVQARETSPPARTESAPQIPTVSIPVSNPTPIVQAMRDPKFSPIKAANHVDSPQPKANQFEHAHHATDSGTNGKDQTAPTSVLMPSNVEHEEIMDLREDDEPEERSPDSAAESTSHARVPWRTYTDTPPRHAPQRLAPQNENPPPPSSAPPTPQQSTVREQPLNSTSAAPMSRPIEQTRTPPVQRQSFADDRYAPLLTPEELQALMADDEEVESLTMDETDALLSDEE
ncbi:MAG: hypothetical protein HY287_11980 [Planctomycetes bacterium]|nr:hypothetical protein [Planctomycetota bacterium]